MSKQDVPEDSAVVIPIGSAGRPGRGSSTRPSSAARGLAPRAGAARSSEPAGTVEPDPCQTGAVEGEGPDSEPTPTPAATGHAAPRRAGATTRDRSSGPLDGVPVGDWIAAIKHGAHEVFGENWEPRLAEFLAFLRHRLNGDYTVDEFGFDEELTTRFVLAVLRPVAEKYFRIEVRGAENIPATGGALVVSNHSGTIPVDGLMSMLTTYDASGRHLRTLGADLVFQLPIVSSVARKAGATLACQADAERMLTNGELVAVFPEGFKGIGKPFSERYRLQRFGRGGFVNSALRTGVPIVPLSIVGAEEIYPLVGNIPVLARLLGLPYVPITPTFPLLGPLGLLPLPSKWLMEYGEPIRTDTYSAAEVDDPMLVFELTDQVRETIQHTLYRLLKERNGVFG